MKARRIVSLVILLAAAGIGGFVIYDNQREEVIDENEKLLQEYIETGGVEEESGLQAGSQAVDFNLPEVLGSNTVALSDLEGSYVVLNMWASWCPPCREEIPDFIDFYENYHDEGVEVVAVNMTTQERSVEDAAQFVDDFNIPFYTLLDEDGRVLEDYDVYHMPTTLLIDPDGEVVMRRPGLINYDMLEEYYKDARTNYEEASDNE